MCCGSGGGGGGGGAVQSAAAERLYNKQADISGELFEWGKKNVQPGMESLVKDAEAYGSAGGQAEAAETASADVGKAFAIQRDAAKRDSLRYGVNPASGKFAGLDRSMGIAEAATKADASTKARRLVRDQGFGLRQAALSVASGQSAPALAGMSSSASGLATMGANAANAQAQADAGKGQLAGNVIGAGLTAAAIY